MRRQNSMTHDTLIIMGKPAITARFIQACRSCLLSVFPSPAVCFSLQVHVTLHMSPPLFFFSTIINAALEFIPLMKERQQSIQKVGANNAGGCCVPEARLWWPSELGHRHPRHRQPHKGWRSNAWPSLKQILLHICHVAVLTICVSVNTGKQISAAAVQISQQASLRWPYCLVKELRSLQLSLAWRPVFWTFVMLGCFVAFHSKLWS